MGSMARLDGASVAKVHGKNRAACNTEGWNKRGRNVAKWRRRDDVGAPHSRARYEGDGDRGRAAARGNETRKRQQAARAANLTL